MEIKKLIELKELLSEWYFSNAYTESAWEIIKELNKQIKDKAINEIIYEKYYSKKGK